MGRPHRAATVGLVYHVLNRANARLRIFNDIGAIRPKGHRGPSAPREHDASPARIAPSIKKGAVPIILLNGESIVDLMIEKEFGVQKKPLQIFEEQLDTIFSE